MQLIQFERDWADEFDIVGIKLMEDEEYELWSAAVTSLADVPCHWYFGTNEGFDDDTYRTLFQGHLDVKDISKQEGALLMKLMPHISKYGVGQWPENIFENEEETPEVTAYWNYINGE